MKAFTTCNKNPIHIVRDDTHDQNENYTLVFCENSFTVMFIIVPTQWVSKDKQKSWISFYTTTFDGFDEISKESQSRVIEKGLHFEAMPRIYIF